MNPNQLDNFRWLNPSKIIAKDNKLLITAHPNSDFSIDFTNGNASLNAAYYYIEKQGDFVLRSKVSHEFKNVYDACTLLLLSNDTHWAKLCFEYTDINTHSVVSVVANGLADDANGVDIQGNTVWLQLARKGNIFAMHYSTDGILYKMVRYFSIPCGERLKVGLEAQSPLGDGGLFTFEAIELENTTLANLRRGI